MHATSNTKRPRASRPTSPNADDTEAYRSGRIRQAPEKKLTQFAVRLALLEHTSSKLGKFAFIWATVVLLGGFATTMGKRDFGLVIGLLVIEGLRIFFRSQELEWKHQAIIGSSCRAINGDRDCNSQRRRWHPSSVPLMPWQQRLIPPRCVSRFFQLLKIFVATAGGVASFLGLVWWDNSYEDGDLLNSTERRNIRYALHMFYGLEVAGTGVFMLELLYLKWMVYGRNLIHEVKRECGFSCSSAPHANAGIGVTDEDKGLMVFRRFFYLSYSKSINGGIFDGLMVDMVSFAEDLLLSDSKDDQLMGASVLRKFVADKDFSEDTMWKIGSNACATERLVEMLNWKEASESLLRITAAEILTRLVDKKQHAIRVAAIPGSLVSVALLLYADDDQEHSFELVRLGLEILNKLVKDHDNCDRIGSTRGLVSQVVKLSGMADQGNTKDEEQEYRAAEADDKYKAIVELSLRLMLSLSSVTGPTGKALRDGMLCCRDTFINLHWILRRRDIKPSSGYLSHKSTAIKVFKQLAIDKKASRNIPCLGGFIDLLFQIFLEAPHHHSTSPAYQEMNSLHFSVQAGKALAEITSKNKDISELIESRYSANVSTDDDHITRMVAVLYDRNHVSRMDAAKILGNLCSSAGGNARVSRFHRLHRAIGCPSFGSLSSTHPTGSTHINHKAAIATPLLDKLLRVAPQVLDVILNQSTIFKEDGIQLDMWIRLITRVFMLFSCSKTMPLKHEVNRIIMVQEFLSILKKPSMQVPNMRRHCIELIIWMMIVDPKSINIFRCKGLLEQLNDVKISISKFEFYDDWNSDDEDGFMKQIPIISLVEISEFIINDNTRLAKLASTVVTKKVSV